MYQPYIDILVDGVMKQRDAYLVWMPHDPKTSMSWGHEELRPRLNEGERLLQTMDGRMEIITISKP